MCMQLRHDWKQSKIIKIHMLISSAYYHPISSNLGFNEVTEELNQNLKWRKNQPFYIL